MPCSRCQGFVILEYPGSQYQQCRCINCGAYYFSTHDYDGDEMQRDWREREYSRERVA